MAVKGRDVRERLRNKADPELVLILAGIAEDYSTQQQEILRLSQLLNELIDNYVGLAQIVGNMGSAPELQRHLRQLQADQKKKSVENVRKGDDDDGMDVH